MHFGRSLSWIPVPQQYLPPASLLLICRIDKLRHPLRFAEKKLHANVRCRYSYTGIFSALAFFGKNLFLFVEVDHARKMNLFTRTALYSGLNLRIVVALSFSLAPYNRPSSQHCRMPLSLLYNEWWLCYIAEWSNIWRRSSRAEVSKMRGCWPG